MFETLLRNLIPMMLIKVAEVSTADKRQYAEFLNELTLAYLTNRRADFANLLNRINLPADWCVRIVEALWRENTGK